MRRILSIIVSLLLLMIVAAPAVLAQEPAVAEGRTTITINGDVTIPAGTTSDSVVVIQGRALIHGSAESVTVIGGSAALEGATVGTLMVIDGTATLGAGTTVRGDVLLFQATADRADGVTIGGAVRPLVENVAGLVFFLGAAAIVLWIGAALVMLVAGLALAGFAGRQVRVTAAIISREPLKVFLVGLAMIFLPPVAMFLLALTLVGLPLALSLLFFVWPTLAFVGYLIAAIWIGDWLLRRSGRTQEVERPYLAAIVGLIIAGVLSIVPLIGAIISIFGLGAVAIAGWRTLVGGPRPQPMMQPHAAPVA